MAATMGMHGLFYAVLFMCTIIPSRAKVIYTVGDSSGWRIGVDYNVWLNGKTFFVGDGLVFNYVKGGHTVDEVSESDYNTCTVGNPIRSDSSGITSVPLTTAGTRYFICGVPGHCTIGMKLAVTVAATQTTTMPSPPPPPSTSSFPVLPPPTTTTPSPPPPPSTSSLPVLPPPTAPRNNTNIPPNDYMTFSSSGDLSPFDALVFASLVAFSVFLF